MPLIGHTIQITIPLLRDRSGKRQRPEKWLHYVGEPNPRKACGLARAQHNALKNPSIRARVMKTHNRDRLQLIQLQPGQVTPGLRIQ